MFKCNVLFNGILLLFACCCCVMIVDGARILAIFPRADIHHDAVVRILARELTASEEHQITLYTSASTDWQLNGVEKIIVGADTPAWLKKQIPYNDFDVMLNFTESEEQLHGIFAQIGAESLEHFLAQTQMTELINRNAKEFNYDVILIDMLYAEALLAFGVKFKCPIVAIVNTDIGDYLEHMRDNYVAVPCGNEQHCRNQRKFFQDNNYVAQQKLITKYFPTLSVQSIPALLSEISLLLLNNYQPLLVPKPLLPNTVFIGGIHIGDMQTLQWDILRFIDEARNGVIYMQLGSRELHPRLSAAFIRLLFDVLGKRKERIIWSYYGTLKIENIPNNIKMHYRTHQASILAHPRMRAFITNGDIISVQSALARNVPIIGIPIYSNEHRNIDRVVRLGNGIKLAYKELTPAAFDAALNRITNDRNYKQIADKIGAQYRDRLAGSAMVAKYHINYLLNYKERGFMKSTAVGVSYDCLEIASAKTNAWTTNPRLLAIGICSIIIAFIFVKLRNNEHAKKK